MSASRKTRSQIGQLSREALARGESRFQPPYPCRKGHVSERYSKNGACVECTAQDNAKKVRPPQVDYQKYGRKWYEQNKERVSQNRKSFREANKEKVQARNAKWAQDNAAILAAKRARRRAILKEACPSWVDPLALREIYIEAQRLTETTGIPHEVDHIYPFTHPNFCGLHVPWNLQIITRTANRKKQNHSPEAHNVA